jgi:predicted P-loop ATPase
MASEPVAILPKARPKNAGQRSTNSSDWKLALEKSGDRYSGNESNVLLTLRNHEKLQQLYRYNEFQNRTEFARTPPWPSAAEVGNAVTDNDDVDAVAWFQANDYAIRQLGVVARCVERVARDQPYHSVREFLAALKWDREPRLDNWLETYLRAAGARPYLRAIGSKFLIAAVARVTRPGCQVDSALVLEGLQGTGKTSVVRILGAPWVTDSVHDMAGADAAIQLAGVWFVEQSELAAMRRSDVEVVKAFISRTVDRYRPPYGKRSIDVPRQCVFVGTTNDAQYLRDHTGNRRFWPVRCGQIDLDGLARDRDQLLAEACYRFLIGEHWHLVGEEVALAAAQQASRRIVSELEQAAAEYLDGRRSAGTTEISVIQIMRDCFDLDAREDVERAGRVGAQLAALLPRLGWQRVGTSGRGENRRTMYRFVPDPSQGLTGGSQWSEAPL